MATVRKLAVKIETQAELILNDSELAALDALFGYDMDVFFKVFYREMGRVYLEPHEQALRHLAKVLRGCSGLSKDANECRAFLHQVNDERMARVRQIVAGK
jgi:hypothetical protein